LRELIAWQRSVSRWCAQVQPYLDSSYLCRGKEKSRDPASGASAAEWEEEVIWNLQQQYLRIAGYVQTEGAATQPRERKGPRKSASDFKSVTEISEIFQCYRDWRSKKTCDVLCTHDYIVA